MAKLIDLKGATLYPNSVIATGALESLIGVGTYAKQFRFSTSEGVGPSTTFYGLYIDSRTYAVQGVNVLGSYVTLINASSPTFDFIYVSTDTINNDLTTNLDFIAWVEDNFTIEGGIWEEETPPTKIKSPVIVIKQKVKQVVIDNANMTIDIYTKEVPATEATVTITNTATNSKYTAYINDNEYIVGPNISITITVPIGTTLEFAGLDVTSGMGYWAHTSSTGDITHDSSPYMTYTINGSGTITGYIYDAD